ncbi:hypothetical protein predicted by Glimmer/Critica [Sorangium cellulosum So ce56]|uniref:Secreted protein n=1 Tax=Sorangium cellulosum (strain So ce56) TaxID=448385 RepID=A9GVP4_SORC5|nr:hypothetical protein [Sorangium cellulosum]CAN93820.1 hypothetical protein predicted by Glimmer/Critica [Sorangium cellulosum So ce56]
MKIPLLGRVLPALALSLLGCAGEPWTLTVEVVPGHEATAFQDDPPVARVEVTATTAEGDVTVSAAAAPGGELDFGEIPAERAYTFEVRGLDAGGATVVRGRSAAGIYLAAVTGNVLPLFAQRTGRWARPPGELAASRVGAPGAALAERYLILTGGATAAGAAAGTVDPARLDAYDLAAWGGSATSGALPRAARSLVVRGDLLLTLDDEGASWTDIASGQSAEASLPEGLGSFAEVAGGRTVEASDGRSFVVGATRAGAAAGAPGAPSDKVLVVGADGALSVAKLRHARAGAAAVWVEGLGLVVAGGSADGAGLEVLGDGATEFSPRPFPPDASEGAGAAVTGPGEIALVGGVQGGAAAPTRRLAPGCAVTCAAVEVEGAALPAAVGGVAAFALPGGRVLALGSEAGEDGLTRSFIVDVAAAQVEELPLREPRRGAAVVPAPNGTLAVLGGVHADGTPALTIETFFPE